MEFITTGNRIAVENFDIGKIYTITWETGNYKSLACTGKGTDFVMFQDQEPDLLFCLTMDSAITVSSIEEGGGGSGTNNYNELENKPSINGFVLVGNKTGAQLGLASQSDLEDYATNASVVAGLATKQDALSSSQLAAVNSGITSELVTQIGTNASAIAGKQDALNSSQLAAVNSGITSELVTQIGTNASAIAGKQDALSSSQLAAVNSGITSSLVTQIGRNQNNILYSDRNKMPYTLSLLKTYNTSGIWNGNAYTVNNITFTINNDMSITVTASGDITLTDFKLGVVADVPLETDVVYWGYGGLPTSDYNYWGFKGGTGISNKGFNAGSIIPDTLSNYTDIIIRISSALGAASLTFKPMIVKKSIYDSGVTDYIPYNNAELYEMILNLNQ